MIAALALGGSAQVDCISQTVGPTTIHHCDGKISTSHTVGSTTVHSIDGICSHDRSRLRLRVAHASLTTTAIYTTAIGAEARELVSRIWT